MFRCSFSCTELGDELSSSVGSSTTSVLIPALLCSIWWGTGNPKKVPFKRISAYTLSWILSLKFFIPIWESTMLSWLIHTAPASLLICIRSLRSISLGPYSLPPLSPAMATQAACAPRFGRASPAGFSICAGSSTAGGACRATRSADFWIKALQTV
jgi:hypothetical protein